MPKGYVADLFFDCVAFKQKVPHCWSGEIQTDPGHCQGTPRLGSAQLVHWPSGSGQQPRKLFGLMQALYDQSLQGQGDFKLDFRPQTMHKVGLSAHRQLPDGLRVIQVC
jgi:hypothetical protein